MYEKIMLVDKPTSGLLLLRIYLLVQPFTELHDLQQLKKDVFNATAYFGGLKSCHNHSHYILVCTVCTFELKIISITLYLIT